MARKWTIREMQGVGAAFLAIVLAAGTAVAVEREVVYVQREFNVGVGVGIFWQDRDTEFDETAFFDLRYAFEVSDAVAIVSHLAFVSYDTDDDKGGAANDVKSIVPSVTVKHRTLIRDKFDVYTQFGLGFMINNSDTATVDNALVFPVGIGIDYHLVGRFDLGFEITHWITEGEIQGSGVELDSTIFALTLTGKWGGVPPAK